MARLVPPPPAPSVRRVQRLFAARALIRRGVRVAKRVKERKPVAALALLPGRGPPPPPHTPHDDRIHEHERLVGRHPREEQMRGPESEGILRFARLSTTESRGRIIESAGGAPGACRTAGAHRHEQRAAEDEQQLPRGVRLGAPPGKVHRPRRGVGRGESRVRAVADGQPRRRRLLHPERRRRAAVCGKVVSGRRGGERAVGEVALAAGRGGRGRQAPRRLTLRRPYSDAVLRLPVVPRVAPPPAEAVVLHPHPLLQPHLRRGGRRAL